MLEQDKIRNSNTPISKAVEPQRKAAVNKAVEHAQSIIDRVHKHLAAHDWDLTKAAPYPNSFNMGREQYMRAKAHHDIHSNLTQRKDKATSYSAGRNQPNVRAPHPEAEARFLKDAAEQAHSGYDSFVAKLHEKVGEHTHAELTGNHVWGHSILHIKHADGSAQKWKTQQIFKLSKLGKPHNQWPTRKVK